MLIESINSIKRLNNKKYTVHLKVKVNAVYENVNVNAKMMVNMVNENGKCLDKGSKREYN